MLTHLQTEWGSGVLVLIGSLALSWTVSPGLYQTVLQCSGPHAQPYLWRSVGGPERGLLFLGIATPQAWFSFRPRAWTWPLHLAASVLAFAAIGTLEALALGCVADWTH